MSVSLSYLNNIKINKASALPTIHEDSTFFTPVGAAALPAIGSSGSNASAAKRSASTRVVEVIKVDTSEKAIKSEIHFIEEVLSWLNRSYPNNHAVASIREEIEFIKDQDFELSKKLEAIKNIFLKQLDSDPDDIKSKLLALDLTGKRIETVSDCITIFENLSSLVLSDNQIEHINPAIFGSLKKLSMLLLTNNQIEFLPESITELENLRYLNLSENQLTELPDGFSNLKLRLLFLGNNPITEVPSLDRSLLELYINPLGISE